VSSFLVYLLSSSCATLIVSSSGACSSSCVESALLSPFYAVVSSASHLHLGLPSARTTCCRECSPAHQPDRLCLRRYCASALLEPPCSPQWRGLFVYELRCSSRSLPGRQAPAGNMSGTSSACSCSALSQPGRKYSAMSVGSVYRILPKLSPGLVFWVWLLSG